MSLHLATGSRVAIVGGGPAGSFAALHLLDWANRRNLRLEITIFEPRNFNRPGPGGCNRCAGILCSRLLHGMEGMGLALPPSLVQADIQAYVLNLGGERFPIERPDAQRRIVSVFRGGGPRLAPEGPAPSFDAYLLDQARARGAQHVAERVREVVWDERPIVHTTRGVYPADFLVLATGANSRAPLAPQFGYQPPQTEIMAQDEILRPSHWPNDQIGVYFRQPQGLVFGAMIPKGPYLSVSLLGHWQKPSTVHRFMEEQTPDIVAAEGFESLCGCTPRVVVRPAPRYFGERWVAVGDAAVTRLYKDGIGSAFFTAQRAMQAAVTHGVAESAFRSVYAPYCRHIANDNAYGRMLFRLWSVVLNTPPLLNLWMRAVRQEAAVPPERRTYQRILWGMFTGDESYRKLFFLSLSPQALVGPLRGWRGSPARWNP